MNKNLINFEEIKMHLGFALENHIQKVSLFPVVIYFKNSKMSKKKNN